MSLAEGQQVELTIEKAASGGRMIARHLGEVVLVRGAIPGERVLAWIEKAEKRMAYAVTREVLEASPDRREASSDPLCGGALYAHIAYPRQLSLKSDVIRDAFARLGRHPVESPIEVAASPEHGYRMRARFHVHGARVGFFREGTHQLCDAAPTRQVTPGCLDAVASIAEVLAREAPGAAVSISISENMPGTERAAYVEVAPGAQVSEPALANAVAAAKLQGIAAHDMKTGLRVAVGLPMVHDRLADVAASNGGDGTVRRSAESFFQGNRYLIADLVRAVVQAVPPEGEVVDLYAGVGLFAVALASAGHLEVTAVEGDRSSGADLRENARPFVPHLRARVERVEDHLAARRGRPPAAVVIDPPRTGLSRDAAAAIANLSPGRLVYVSCDPPTLARDARRLLDAGYRMHFLRGFDLFPNTPHVEALAVFSKAESIS
jgi:23S rRNA (uracil1939-C5)-methyltransferase